MVLRWYIPCFTSTFVLALWFETQYDPIFKSSWFLPVLYLVCGAVYFLWRRFSRNKLIVSLLLGLCIGCSYCGVFVGMVHKPLASLDGKQTTIHATVTGYAERYEDTQRVPLKIHTGESGISFWMPWFHTMAYVPLTEKNLQPGDHIEAKASFYQGAEHGGFDRTAYYSGRNMHILASCDNPDKFVVHNSASIPWDLKPLLWTQELKDRLHRFLVDADASFLQALLFGDKSDLTVSIDQDFQKAGLSHIMAVSGMHVGFLVMFFILILGRRFGLIASFIALILFVPMAGASPSVIRAAIMYAFVAVGFFLRRDHSTIHSFCFALLLLLIHNPYAINSLSLQLSFLATLGLILFSTKLQNKLLLPLQQYHIPNWCKKGIRFVMSALACSICASIFTTPILLRTFGYVSIASVLANILTLGVFSILFLLGFVLCFLGGIPVLGAILASGIHILCSYVFIIAHVTGDISILLLYWDFWYVKLGVLLLYIVPICAWIAKQYISFSCASALACIILLLTIGINASALTRKYEMQLFSSGNGQCIAVSYGQKHLAIIDCAINNTQGTTQELIQYMDWNGFSDIDMVIITSLDNTHARDLPALLQAIPIKQLVIPAEYRQTPLSDTVFSIAKQKKIPVTVWALEGEHALGDTRLGISIIGGIPKKLGVHIAKGELDFLTLHGFTPRMVEQLLSSQQITCPNLILSNYFLEEQQDTLLKKLQPQQLYVPDEYIDSGQVCGIPLQTTQDDGDIMFREILPHGGIAYGR